ncbi:MAG: hypothetical protein LQ337_006261 [Flavoplaca oasis]|nr:MAG: hypothetical protein LQ337_006261 [Flavoplaca oasis]
MLNFFTPALLAISTISSITATPLPEPKIATHSILTAPGFIPPDFSIQYALGHERLDIDSAIMAITKTLYELSSSEDFLNDVIAPVTYFCKGYTSVAVTIRGVNDAMDLPVRYAVWGAVEIGRTMVRWQEVHNHTFALRWRETVVGLIDLVKTPGPGQPSLGKNDPEDAVLSQLATTAPQTPDPIATTLPLGEEREITLSIWRIPNMPFSKWDLFIQIWYQLLYVNTFPPRQGITSEWVKPREEATTSFAPSGPPFNVEYRDVAFASMSVAFYVLERHVVNGLVVRLSLEERLIGKLSIYRGDAPMTPLVTVGLMGRAVWKEDKAGPS